MNRKGRVLWYWSVSVLGDDVMPKYKVRISETTVYCVTVTNTDEDNAADQARDLLQADIDAYPPSLIEGGSETEIMEVIQ